MILKWFLLCPQNGEEKKSQIKSEHKKIYSLVALCYHQFSPHHTTAHPPINRYQAKQAIIFQTNNLFLLN